MDSRDRRSRDLRRSFSSTRDRSLSRGRHRRGSTSTSPDPRDRTRAYSLADSSSSASSSRSRSRRSDRRRRRQQRSASSSSRRRTPPPARRTPKSRAASPKPTAMETLKSSAPLLATIGVASVLAHKLWPKGVLFGDKEEWETRKVVSRTVERGEDGRIRRERHVRKEDGEIVVDDFMRRNRRRDEELGRREGSLDGADHRPRAIDRRRMDALEPAPPPRRPLSMYEEDRPPPRRYDAPPHDRRLAPAYPNERHAPRAGDRYVYEDPRYDDRDRRPGRAYNDRPVYDDRYYER